MIRLTVVIFLFSALSCNNQGTKNPVDRPAKDTTTAAKTPFFPVAAFLSSEISAVDSLPVGIKQYHQTNGATLDSGYINSDSFHRLAAEFLTPEISEPAFSEGFTESSFFDRATNTGTFYYTPKSEKSTIKRVDVLSMRTDVYDEVKSIYIEKNHSQGVKKLYWKPGRYFQIIRQSSGENGHSKTELIKVVWDNRE